MVNIIIVFSNQNDVANMRNLLTRHGHHIVAACVSGSAVLQKLDQMEGSDGIIISGARYTDMTYQNLLAELPSTYQMVLMAPPRVLDRVYEPNVTKVALPVKAFSILEILEEAEETLFRQRRKRRKRPKERSVAEKALLEQAKAILIEKKNMTEEEAHRYIQQCSMNNGTSLVETAQMVIGIYA